MKSTAHSASKVWSSCQDLRIARLTQDDYNESKREKENLFYIKSIQ